MIVDVVSGVLLVAGSFWTMAAGVALARFPDALARLHAVAKPQVLGLLLVLAGLAVWSRSLAVTVELLLVILFQFVTNPLAAHMVGRAAIRTGAVRPELLVINELPAGELPAGELPDGGEAR